MRPNARLLPLLLALVPASSARAQIRASELAVTRQTIDGTVLTVEYSRPRVRGRSSLFGERKQAVVHWDEVWTPGANFATTLQANRAFTLSGQTIPAGKYSMWLIPKAQGAWTMVLDTTWRAYHTETPDSVGSQIRFPVSPSTGAFEEALTFAFTGLSVSGATLELRWGTTRVAMPLKVTPSLTMTTPVADAERFTGRYEWQFTDGDSTRFLVTLGPEKGYLMGTIRPGLWTGDFALVRVHASRDWFTFAIFDRGEIFDVEAMWVAEFSRGPDGKIDGFVVRNDTDQIEARARKLP